MQLSDLKLRETFDSNCGSSRKTGEYRGITGTADAANLDAVIIANPKSDMYSPNIVVQCRLFIQTKLPPERH
jgi:TrmH family RNA methyltransferase